MPRRSQQERTQATREALLSTARGLFAARGYNQVPADEIANAAGVTRGAMYHHFADKAALFEAVFQELEAEVAAEIAVSAGQADGWGAVAFGLNTFLDICERPEVQRIALTDAPAVLGWSRWRQIEAQHGLGIVLEMLGRLADEGQLVSQAPVPVLAQLALSASIEAALLIANADDRAAARADAQNGLLTLLSGMIRQP